MIFRELNQIGQTFVCHPFKYIPHDILPRDEIAAPYKLQAALNKSPLDWTNFNTTAMIPMHQTWVSWDEAPDDIQKRDFTAVVQEFWDGDITPTGFFVVATDKELFLSAAEVDGTDSISISEWLQYHNQLNNFFIITCPIYVLHGEALAMPFTVTNDIPIQTRYIPMIAPLNQLLDHCAYTLGSPLNLALAMERAGVWDSAAVTDAIEIAFPTDAAGGSNLALGISPSMLPFYLQHFVQSIRDYPGIYASMGPNTCSRSTQKILTQKNNNPAFASFPVIQNIDENNNNVVTSILAASFPFMSPGDWQAHNNSLFKTYLAMPVNVQSPITYPYNPQDLFATLTFDPEDADDDEEEEEAQQQPVPAAQPVANPAPPPTSWISQFVPDMGGFIHSLVDNEDTWLWWTDNDHIRQRYMTHLIKHTFDSIHDCFDHLLRRLFQLYHINDLHGHEEKCKRLENLWTETIKILDPECKSIPMFTAKYLLGSHLRANIAQHLPVVTEFGSPRKFLWCPPVPKAFITSMLQHFRETFHIFQPQCFTILSNHLDLMEASYGSYIIETMDTHAPANRNDPLTALLPPRRYRFRVAISIFKALSLYAEATIEATCYDDLSDIMTKRLTALRKGFMNEPMPTLEFSQPYNTVPTSQANSRAQKVFSEHEFATIHSLMTDHFQRHRMDLVL